MHFRDSWYAHKKLRNEVGVSSVQVRHRRVRFLIDCRESHYQLHVNVQICRHPNGLFSRFSTILHKNDEKSKQGPAGLRPRGAPEALRTDLRACAVVSNNRTTDWRLPLVQRVSSLEELWKKEFPALFTGTRLSVSTATRGAFIRITVKSDIPPRSRIFQMFASMLMFSLSSNIHLLVDFLTLSLSRRHRASAATSSREISAKTSNWDAVDTAVTDVDNSVLS